jgi:hypothetical protein
MMRGSREAASFFFTRLGDSAFSAVAIMSLFFLASTFLRRKTLAAIVLGGIWIVSNLSGENFGIEIPFAIADSALLVFVLLRFGLLATAVAGFVNVILVSSPITLDFSQWYAGRSFFALAICAGVAAYGFWTALGKRPVFGAVALQED